MKSGCESIVRKLLVFVLIVSVGQIGLHAIPAWAQKTPPDRAGDHANIISGTVEEIAPGLTKVRIKTDLGQSLLFEVTNPELLQDMAAGDQITIELNQEGKEKKVTKMTIPELKAPPRTK